MKTKLNRYFGQFGGMFVPEILLPALLELENAYVKSIQDKEFQDKLAKLLHHYAGRPTPLTLCRNFSPNKNVKIYLKREDLLHGGAHKTNQVIGQGLLAKSMGKNTIIAETGAGQHGVATATICALLGMKCRIYMGCHDIERQKLNVFRMQLMGAEVISVDSGSGSLKDAINEALRDWSASYQTTHYMLGTAAGPHPYPTMVRDFQKIIGRESKLQLLAVTGKLPDAVFACVGGGSNAIGIFNEFIPNINVSLYGVEPGGKGINSGKHGAALTNNQYGILHGAYSAVMQNKDGQIEESYSISAGLDYPAVGPEHAFLKSIGRVNYSAINDDEAVEAFLMLSKKEGIIPALESAHALALAYKIAKQTKNEQIFIVNLSGRGDKDLDIVNSYIKSNNISI